MMRLLSGFAALSLISGILIPIIPEGAMRRTASMAVGLMMLMYWSEGLSSLADNIDFSIPEAPASILAVTGIDLSGNEAALIIGQEGMR